MRRWWQGAGGAALAAMFALSGSASADQVLACDAQANPAAIVEPWETQTRVWANGAIRLGVLDMIEPACCPLRLIVLAPDPEFGRACWMVVPDGGNGGWVRIDLDRATAAYDPARGLGISVPVWTYDFDRSGGVDPNSERPVRVLVNQSTGQVSVE